MKILISGGSGFLGFHLTNFLINLKHEVISFSSKECDLLSEKSLNKYSDIKFNMIIHLAAWTQAGDFCLKFPGDQWINNQKINTNMLSWWKDNQRQAKFIFMGTSCSYDPNFTHTEDLYTYGKPIDSLYTYAITKRMLYDGVKALSKQYDLNYLCFVPSTLYGTNYKTDGKQLHFIFDLIKKIIRGKEYDEDVILWGDGFQKREIIFIDDFINIMWNLVQENNNDIFNIGAGEEYSIRQFAEIISDIVGFDKNLIIYDESKYVGAKSKFLNTRKINSLIEYELISLRSGLSRTIDWFYKNGLYKNDSK